MSTAYNLPHTLVLIQGKTLSKTRIHTTYPMHFVIGYCFFYHILHMLVGIIVAMFQLKTNYSHHKPILIDPTNSTLKQQPIISMDTPKQGKRGGNGWVWKHIVHESFWIHENDYNIDFQYLTCFVALHKCNHNIHYIFQPFMFTL